MKDFKQDIINFLLEDQDLIEFDNSLIKRISSKITHDIMILKSNTMLERLAETIIDDSVNNMLLKSDLFIVLSSSSKLREDPASTVLIKQHLFAEKYIEELYSSFNFRVDSALNVLVFTDLLSEKKYLVEDTTFASFLFKQTIIPLLKRI